MDRTETSRRTTQGARVLLTGQLAGTDTQRASVAERHLAGDTGTVPGVSLT